MPTIAALIVTYNADKLIQGCLDSVAGWVDEIIVVDMFSQDKTVEIAKRYTSSIFLDKEGSHEKRTNIGIEKAHSDWILKVLATERITPDLKEEILASINDKDKQDIVAYHIPRRSYCTCEFIEERPGPIYLFKKNAGKFDCIRLHSLIEIKGKIGRLKNFNIHWASFSFEHGIDKLNRYTSIEARMAFLGNPGVFWWKRPVKKVTFFNIIYRTMAGFYMFYFQAKFYRYGLHGFIESILTAFYFFAEMAKLWEFQYKEKYNIKEEALPLDKNSV